jgi:hypothetical protein
VCHDFGPATDVGLPYACVTWLSADLHAVLTSRAGQDGRYWARTSDPSLSIRRGRSRPFAHVRPDGIVERKPLGVERPKRT